MKKYQIMYGDSFSKACPCNNSTSMLIYCRGKVYYIAADYYIEYIL